MSAVCNWFDDNWDGGSASRVISMSRQTQKIIYWSVCHFAITFCCMSLFSIDDATHRNRTFLRLLCVVRDRAVLPVAHNQIQCQFKDCKCLFCRWIKGILCMRRWCTYAVDVAVVIVASINRRIDKTMRDDFYLSTRDGHYSLYYCLLLFVALIRCRRSPSHQTIYHLRAHERRKSNSISVFFYGFFLRFSWCSLCRYQRILSPLFLVVFVLMCESDGHK